ncbi:MAG: flagellar biosynthesis protein FlaG [Asticcacaulis sp.]
MRSSPELVTQVNGVAPVEAAKKSDTNSDLADQSQSHPQPNYMLKLTVDKDPDTGEFIYKAIDRYTGEVVRQLPQKELIGLRRSDSYQPGSVITTDI